MENDSGNSNNELKSTGSPADETTVPNLPRLAVDSSSRRNFLKAAVVASAAVAAAGGAAGVALVSGQKPQSLRFIGDLNSGDPCDACIEDTNYVARTYMSSNTNSPPGYCASTPCAAGTIQAGFVTNGTANTDFELFFVDHAPSAGTINLTITVSGSSQTITESNVDIDSSQLFTFPPGKGNYVTVTEQSAVPSAPCMAKGYSSVATLAQESQVHTGANPGAYGTSGISYTPTSANDDVLTQLHLTWNGGKIGASSGDHQLYTFKFSWTDSGGTSCTKYLFIYGEQQ